MQLAWGVLVLSAGTMRLGPAIPDTSCQTLQDVLMTTRCAEHAVGVTRGWSGPCRQRQSCARVTSAQAALVIQHEGHGGQLCGRRTIIGPSPACRGTSTHVWGPARAMGEVRSTHGLRGGGAGAHHLPEKPVHDLSPCRVVLHPEPAVNHVSSQEVSQRGVPAQCTFHKAMYVGEQLDSPLVALSRHAAHRGRT